MNLHANLCALYNETAADDPYHLAVGGLLRHLGEVGDLPVQAIADLCHVSKSTLERLVRRLGYRGLPTFRADLAQLSSKYTYFNRVLPAASIRGDRETLDAYAAEIQATLDALRSTVDLAEVRRVVEALREARRVVFYTMGRVFAEASLQFSLAVAGKEALVLDRYADQAEDAERLDDGCVAFVETFDAPSTLDMEPVIRTAKARGARIVLLTLNAASQYAALADFRLVARQTETMVGDYGLQMLLDLVHLLFRREVLDRPGGAA